jgi:hypothetical protein
VQLTASPDNFGPVDTRHHPYLTQQQITRQQLRGHGMSLYHTRSLTKGLVIQGKSDDRHHLYSLPEVIQSIRQYLEKSRLKFQSRNQLEQVLNILIKQLSNLVSLPFQQGRASELSEITKELRKSMIKTDQALENLKAQAAAIKGKYHKS